MKRKMWWLKRYSTPHLCARYLMFFCTVGFVFLPTSYVWANPAGEQVVGGAATFQREGNTLTVNQATDRLAVNWQSFNIAAGERTHFNMPSSTSAALNRVIGGNPSSIYGSLSANGILYLINPSGILVGPGGTVNAAAFMASTLDVSTEQFMNAKNGGAMNFYGSSGESIINQGNITAEKGDVFLIAQKVENRGTINAANGTAGMVGSGQNTDVMVHEVGGKGFAIRVAQLQGEAATGSNRDLPDGEELLNEGSINAAQAELNASGNIYALAIRNSGTIRAKAVVANADGTVRLDGGLGDVINTGKMYANNAGDDATAAGGKIDIAGQNITASPESIITAAGGEQGGNGGSVKIDSQDTTIVQGKVDVTAPSAGAKGGKVELLGERVGLLDGAKVDASGGAGGGTVLVGGDYLGGQTPKPELKDLAKLESEPVKNAKATVMADTAEIKADATVNGDGGKVILWSDEYTGFYGDLFARGGTEGGNGGFIETSSKNNLQAMGAGIASAANGTGGLWLLDPANVELTAATANGSFSAGTTDPNIFTPIADSATVNVATINSSLNSGTSVTIQTGFTGSAQQGNITQATDGAISKTTGVEATLTLQANGSITLTQDITSTSNALDLVLAAGSANNFDSTDVATSAINLQANLTLNGGDLILNNSGTGGIIQSISGAIVTSGQTAIAGAGGVVTLTQAGNNFGIIGGTGTTTQITDLNGLILSGSTFSGATTIIAGGSISQVGLVKVTLGGLTLTVSASGSNIDLSTSANSITGGVTIGGTATNVQDFKLRNVVATAAIPVNFASMTKLRDLTVFYDAAAFVIPNLQQAQATLRNISITANGGAITQNATGGIVASGTASFTSSGAITVANTGNDFGGAVSATATGANGVTLLDTDDLTLGVISMGSAALTVTFGKDLLTNAGLSLDGRIINGGAMTLTPTVLGSDIILGAAADNANDIGGAVTINNSGNVRDFVLRNVNTAAGTIVNLAGATNLRDVSINYPLGTYVVPTFTSTSFRDLSVYANLVDLTSGPVTSNNGNIELYQANAAGTFTLANNVNTLAGDIRILSDGALTVNTGVVIGGQTTGAITLSADAGGLGTGLLTLTGTAPGVGAVVGSANNASVITLQAASVIIGATATILQGAGRVILTPSTLVADIDLGTLVAPLSPFSIDGLELNRIFSSGTVQVGGESQVGDINLGTFSLTSNTFSTLKLTGSSASRALLGADASLRTFGTGLNFDVNLDLDDNFLVIDTTQAGFFLAGANILFGKQVDSDRTLAFSGGRISLTAGTAGNVEFAGTVGGINPVQFLQVTSGNEVTVGRVTARVGGVNGPGGLVSLTGNTVTVNGVLNVDAITTAAGPGEAGGQILITGRDVILNNRVTANGGDGVVNLAGANFGGGSAGEIRIRAVDSLSVNPTPDAEIGGSFSALGGDPSGGNAGFGADGIIQLASDRDLYFTTNQEAERETQYSISAGRNLVFASFLNTIIPDSSVGGVSFRMNVNNTEVSRVNLNLAFAQSDSTGILYMAPGSTIQMNGGTLSVNKDQNLTTGRIEFANIDVVNSPSFGLTYTGTSQLKFSGSITGSNTQGGNGAVVSISAENAEFIVEGGITVNGDDGAAGEAGNVSITAKSINIGEIQANGGGGDGGAGRGGTIDLVTTTGGIEVGSIFGQGGIEDTIIGSGGFGGRGGKVVLRPGGLLDGGRGALEIGTINVSGGACADPLGVGGTGGRITIEASENIFIPSNMFVGGGDGDQTRGAPGEISITTTGSADIALKESNLVISGTGNLNLNSARNLIIGTVDFDAATPLDTISAGSLTLNDGAVAGDTLGKLVVTYGQSDPLGKLIMPSSSVIDSNGGGVTMTGIGGQAQVGSIFTSLADAAGGSININTGGGLLMAGGFLFTQGSDAAAAGNQGLAGGSITLQGSSVSVGSINTSAGGSSSTARLFGKGGQGGNVSITATGVGGQITLQRDLVLTGGKGLSTRDGIGGSGGRIALSGNVVLDSGSGLVTAINFNTAGGTGLAAGGSGSGGAIVVTGSLTGTSTTSNTLQLSHGSGAVTLGAVTLSELITADATGVAADSTGAVTINGALNLTTLTTQGFGYSLSILGGGSIANRVTFLNTGTTTIGAAGVTTTFTDGFDALNGTTVPSTLLLGGTIDTVTATTGSILADTTVLVANTTLNSTGNIIQLGTLDGAFTLDLAAGVAGGGTTFSGAIGSTTEVGQITITGGIDSDNSTTVNFLSTVTASGITSGANSNLTFLNDVTLSGTGGATDLGGTVTLNNADYVDDLTAVLSFLGAGAKTFSGTTTLEGGPIEFGGLGGYTVSGAISGAQNLILSGGVSGISGAKNFSGTVGGTDAIGTGTDAAITMSGGDVTFGALTTAGGLASTANVIFNGSATLGAGDTGTTLDSDVTLSGATISSAGSFALGNDAVDAITLNTGTVTLTGAGAYTVNGIMVGAQQLVLGGAGTKTFVSTADVTGFTQDALSGTVTFQGDVTTTGESTLGASTVLDGMTFTANGVGVLGSTTMNGVTLSTGLVTLAGAGNYTVNGAVTGGGQDLTLSGAGGKTFNGALSGLDTLALSAGTGTFSSTISGVVFNQSGGVAVLNGNGTFSGASTLGGTSTTLNGITFSAGTTLVTGVLTSTGATTMTGGEITLDTASAVTSGSGTLTLGNAVSLAQNTTLAGAGAYQLNGTVNGANSLTLDGDGAKTFSGEVGTGVGTALTTFTQANDSGLVTFAENVTMSGAGAFDANLVLDGLTITSTLSTLTFGNTGTDTAVISGASTITTFGQNITLNSATTLNAGLILSDAGAVGGVTTLSGAIAGASSTLSITTDDLVVANTVATGSGVVSLFKKDGLALTVGGVAAGFLNATEISRISTSGGLTVATGGNITLNQLVLGDTDQITGAFKMVTSGGDIDVAQAVALNVFGGSAVGGALTATGSTLTDRLTTQGFRDLTLGVGGLAYDGASSMTLSGVQVRDDVLVSSVGSMVVNGSVASVTGDIGLESAASSLGVSGTVMGRDVGLVAASNLNMAGTITAARDVGLVAAGDVIVSSRITGPNSIGVDAGRYFINSFAGNPFQSADTRIATTDLFGATWPSNGAVPGLQVRYDGQGGANTINVSTTLLAGNGGPFILEFTTGTGQPYILAQQAAIPPVMMPATITGGTGFAQAVTYEADDLEMMTPEERNAYESQQRRMSARVILQNQSGEGEEIGAPTEGRTPQAANPSPSTPTAPTAQVLLQGKPLAGVKTDREKGDASKIIKVHPVRAVALGEVLHLSDVLESERLAAEVSVGAASVVQNR